MIETVKYIPIHVWHTMHHVNNIRVDGKARGIVRFKVDGTATSQAGEYVTERNTTETVTVTEDRARQIRDDLTKLLEDDE
jgi:hypothetical protein